MVASSCGLGGTRGGARKPRCKCRRAESNTEDVISGEIGVIVAVERSFAARV